MPQKIHVLFHVPEGFESVASKDIEATLADIQQPTYSHAPKTGRVHLFCAADSIDTFKQYIQSVQLLSIYSVMLVASESVMPADAFAEVQPTYDYISNQTKKAPWYSIISEDPQNQNTAISFRATFKKEQIKHKAPSQQIAGYVGFAFSNFFKHWKVKMTGFTYEIVSLWFQTSDVAYLNHLGDPSANDQSVILILGVDIPLQNQNQRNRVFVGRTSLNPCIAYCLALVADPKPGQVILDMCCGTGTIPIEGASRFKNVFWLGSEVTVKTLAEKALGNVVHCQLKNVDLLLGDGRKLCFRDSFIDSIVSDSLVLIVYNTIKLYPKFVKQMHRILKPDGKAYIVTQGHKLMNRVLHYDWCQKLWSVDEILPIGIGGLDAYLYTLSKNGSTVATTTAAATTTSTTSTSMKKA
ncbi:hypothetical protein [Parasitella parasitica]|uniref:Ribosomal RNA large subunit methyltransferase K/L-like methyltransferase domain-containing protein n=1 Tax=Parasitella parasitica TaxID=35722 RepID=A0A0B7NTD0_9FUNG|nr:hypothetical protein [Parasitella parasitica]